MSRPYSKRELAGSGREGLPRMESVEFQGRFPGYVLNDEPGTLLCSWPEHRRGRVAG